MGSFSYTCAASGLPIEAGDPVRWFLLTESPFQDECYSYSSWFPRTWPIRANYDDYGSIEDWETGPLLDVILKGFQLDLLEQGQGPNPYHDPPTSKDMSFEDLLSAVGEDAVRVQREYNLFDDDEEEAEQTRTPVLRGWLPSYQPTLKKIQDLCPDLNVTEEYPGFCLRIRDRIRKDRLTTMEEALAELNKGIEACRLAGYAVALTAGTNQDYAQAVVFTSPGMTQEGATHLHPRQLWVGPHRNEGLHVRQAMIREDVWRKLLKLKYTSWGTDSTRKDYDAAPTAYLKRLAEMRSTIGERKAWMRLMGIGHSVRSLPGESLLGRSIVPFTVGLQEHTDLLDPIPEGFETLMGDFAFLFDYLATIRHRWYPSSNAGPQYGEWKTHREFHAAMSTLRRLTRRSGKKL